jgi:hypothetical protein
VSVQRDELLSFLTECAADRLALIQRHEAAARAVSHYDFNNAYQYVIAREDVQVTWLSDAIADLGGQPEEVPEPVLQVSGKRDAAQTRFIGEDRDLAQTFVDKWRPRVDAMPNARHRSMLRVILGETLEHKRFFEQALAGRVDLLGRRQLNLEPARGDVLPSRWIE